MSKKYDSTVARIAGNIASGYVDSGSTIEQKAVACVALARAIVAEVRRTEPPETKDVMDRFGG